MVDEGKNNIAEAIALEKNAAKLLKQSGALMDEARALREESMRLRELARRLRPQKSTSHRGSGAPKAKAPKESD